MKLKSHAILSSDFETDWYKKWAVELKQDDNHLESHKIHANKFWQNAVMCQILSERNKLRPDNKGVGFGVGQERLPAVFAKHHVRVLATDQDFEKPEARHWEERELAKGLGSLNTLGICEPEIFNEMVEFLSVDMNDIPHDLYNKFDFLWSNCSLGHLGYITNGLEFIRNSAKCLKPGGVAVHTTELNILSDIDTLRAGNTVIFRLRDIYELFKTLTAEGYRCSPLRFDLGNSNSDFRLGLRPQFGTDYTKIQVGGYLATQVVLIITKPLHKITGERLQAMRRYNLYLNNRLNHIKMRQFNKANPNIIQLLKSQSALPENVLIKPLREKIAVNIKKSRRKAVYVRYINNSDIALYAKHSCLVNMAGVVLATDMPQDRKSMFSNKTWLSQNRASSDLYAEDNYQKQKSIDYIEPHKTFSFRLVLDAKNVKLGNYIEHFSVVMDDLCWVADSGVEILVHVEA